MRLFSSDSLFFSILLFLASIVIISEKFSSNLESISTQTFSKMVVHSGDLKLQEQDDVCHFQECVPGGTRASKT